MNFAEAPTLTTSRLRLRSWRETDLAPFAALNADPAVVEFLPKPLTRDESDLMVERIQDGFAQRGFGLWAVEVVDSGAFAGLVGLGVPRFDAPFTPCVEIAWRLGPAHWGHGYATEAASAALDFGFREQGLNEIVSFTVPANLKSRAVMDRLGMQHDPAEDFDHPLLPEGHRLRRHVLYRLPAVPAEHRR
ncbi:MAG: GNAT family N-acetyltransferase [Propionibacteriaceae bacterium]